MDAAKNSDESVAAGEPLADWEKELLAGSADSPTESQGA
jgi:hypothetical protein